MRIGVISDTHGLLRPEVPAALEGVDHILHAGDVGAPDILPALERIAPVTAVRGNVDTGDWALSLPERRQLTLGDHGICMVHDRAALAGDPPEPGTGIVIFGHSHKPGCSWEGDTLYINPGSAGRRRFRLPVTLVILTLGSVPEPRIVDLV